MKYFIGIDGGGTKTTAVLTNSELVPQFETSGGPSNFLIIGTEKVSKTLYELILKCIKSKALKFSDVAGIVLGTTGAGRPADARKLKEFFLGYSSQKGSHLKSFEVESDARIALEGAFAGNPGSILIAGTGSIMFGKDSDGNVHRVGGFGRFIGDEGSGYSLGRKGLIQIAKYFDGRKTRSVFTDLFIKTFLIADSAALITEVYSNDFDIASVAPIVIESAEKGDNYCLQILDEEINELILHIRSMIKLINSNRMRLCLIGGTIATENFYSTLFKSKVMEVLPEVKIQEAEFPPAIGAAIIAKSRFG